MIVGGAGSISAATIAYEIELRVDDEVKRPSNTENFIFDVGKLFSYIGKSKTLRQGDVISTVTHGDVGFFRAPVDVLEPGQATETEIEGIWRSGTRSSRSNQCIGTSVQINSYHIGLGRSLQLLMLVIRIYLGFITLGYSYGIWKV